MTAIPKKKSFAMHPQLLWDVITKQAGTPGKALLEGVMNCIDAGATKIDLTLTTTGFTLADDGRGFGSEREIDEFFSTFGTPHNEGDARFGRFRMGRGQIFSFASTVWTSNCSQMVVDIKTKGLDYDYHTVEAVPGCIVVGKFYEILSARDLFAAQTEVIRNCLYVEVPLAINGAIVNKDPAKVKWAHETKEARFNLRSGEAKGIDVYQQGVFVETIPATEFGMSGTIVTRVGYQLRVNFARNQVLRSCPLFQKILRAVGKESRQRVATRQDLDDSEREMIVTGMVKTCTLTKDLHRAKIFRDTTGRYWSVLQIKALLHSDKMLTRPDGRRAYSFAPLGSRLGDSLMQEGRGFVFDEDCFKAVGGSPKTGLEKCSWFRSVAYYMGIYHAVFVPLVELSKNRETSYTLLEDSQLTAREKMFLRVAGGSLHTVRWSAEDALGIKRKPYSVRTVRLGVSQTADGWTDGESFIAINRKFIANLDTEAGGMASLATLLLHEYIHTESDSCTHTHTPEFYRAYHDASVRALKSFTHLAVSAFRSHLRTAGRKLNKTETIAAARAHEQAELAARVLGDKAVAA